MCAFAHLNNETPSGSDDVKPQLSGDEFGKQEQDCLDMLHVNIKKITRVEKNQLDAQLILSIFRETLHVSGVSRPIIKMYNRMYTVIPRLTKIIRSGITFVSRNVIFRRFLLKIV